MKCVPRLSLGRRWRVCVLPRGWRSRCPRDWLREPDDRWVRPLCATDSVDRSALVIGESVSADCDSSLPASRAQQFEFFLVKSRGQISISTSKTSDCDSSRSEGARGNFQLAARVCDQLESRVVGPTTDCCQLRNATRTIGEHVVSDLHSGTRQLCPALGSPRRALERSLRTSPRRRWVADEARACRLPRRPSPAMLTSAKKAPLTRTGRPPILRSGSELARRRGRGGRTPRSSSPRNRRFETPLRSRSAKAPPAS